MKATFTTILFFCIAAASAIAQCDTTHTRLLGNYLHPDTIGIDSHNLQFCWQYPCPTPVTMYDESVQIGPDPSITGPTRVYLGGWTGTALARVAILSPNCDTVYATKCLGYARDSIDFVNVSGNYILQYSTNHGGLVWVFSTLNASAFPDDFSLCNPQLATAHPPQLPITYRKFDPYTGQISPETQTQPAGLSIRSDGTKCYRVWQIATQPPNSTIVLVFAALALVVICLKSWFPEKTE